MKRCWIGVGLLIFLLIFSLVTGWVMDGLHAPVVEKLQQAQSAVLAGDLDLGKRFGLQAEGIWFRWQGVRNCFADHGPAEEIDAQFALLRSFGEMGEDSEFAALAAQTAGMVQAVAEAHRLRLETFF